MSYAVAAAQSPAAHSGGSMRILTLSIDKRACTILLATTLCCGLVHAPVRAGSFPATIELGKLERADGFRIDGRMNGESLGRSVAGAGDVNGDHISDLIVGAAQADWNGLIDSGSAYIIFGRNTLFPRRFNISKLRKDDGFRIDGAHYGDHAGGWVDGAGDVNGDGIADLVLSAPLALPHGYNSGSAYIVFGRKSGFPGSLRLSDLTSASGYRINGDHGSHVAQVAAAGDVNNDGIDDVLISGYPSFVVFGRTSGVTHPIRPSDLDGTNGFRLKSRRYSSISGIRDVNNDGIDDIMVASFVKPFTYVVFGKSTDFAADLDPSTLDGSNGFRLDGAFAASGAGDLNGDGIADLVIATTPADFASAYVVFGRANGFPADLDVSKLNGKNGFRFDFSGQTYATAAARAGDVNNDGISDVMIGTHTDGGFGVPDSDNVYVLFGRNAFPATFNVLNLDGTNGFDIVGVPFESIGFAIDGAGDVNADGVSDLIIGSPTAEYGGSGTGSAYVVYGRP